MLLSVAMRWNDSRQSGPKTLVFLPDVAEALFNRQTMNNAEFTNHCMGIKNRLKGGLHPQLFAKLEFSRTAIREHRNRVNSLAFPIWAASPAGFWHPNYGNYTVIHDPDRAMVEAALFQIRFIFFLKRKETGKGRFSLKVREILEDLNGREGFELGIAKDANDEGILIVLKKTYDPLSFGSAGDDLKWLIKQTLPQFQLL
jgi:hypothetical protein